jgi:hypothetical protein
MKKTPFNLLIGYTPSVHQLTRTTDIPTLNQRLSSIKKPGKPLKRCNKKCKKPGSKINHASNHSA